ncbi:hypothetical protein K461DRAFT_268609 [Myriangium duriaei CBS 260.36]|uniref:Uncharacterized protein n=1 Tax=Myriangium duriaei CBS 260.36 TaxID=1168546 RepID=A0A9P4J115_9PEZI|nr:hypothetical protein K461DRAFT_268609 [Myriangium duriaei CBS 260.36]
MLIVLMLAAGAVAFHVETGSRKIVRALKLRRCGGATICARLLSRRRGCGFFQLVLSGAELQCCQSESDWSWLGANEYTRTSHGGVGAGPGGASCVVRCAWCVVRGRVGDSLRERYRSRLLRVTQDRQLVTGMEMGSRVRTTTTDAERRRRAALNTLRWTSTLRIRVRVRDAAPDSLRPRCISDLSDCLNPLQRWPSPLVQNSELSAHKSRPYACWRARIVLDPPNFFLTAASAPSPPILRAASQHAVMPST